MEQMTLLNLKAKNPTSGCKGTIATFVIDLLREGELSPREIAERTRAKFNSKTTEKCVYWYASKQKIDLKGRQRKAAPVAAPLGLMEQAESLGNALISRIVDRLGEAAEKGLIRVEDAIEACDLLADLAA
jgi:hypothetical protein